MKSKVVLNLTVILICTFLMISCNRSASSKQNASLKPFKIKIEKNEEEIKLQCLNGCRWKELTFTKNNYQPQAINEFGMVEPGKEKSTDSGNNLASFLFTVTKTQDGIELVGKKGTAWKELQFGLPNFKTQLIDQMGMTK